MKLPLLLILFLSSATWSFGQRYYVAVVKGQVYYQDKLLKKRDKIKMKGQLKFSTDNDYVKLSGPGGLYTVRPDSDPTVKNEFIVAVKEELFPRVRLLPTTSNTMVMDGSSYFFFQGASYTFIKKTQIQSRLPVLKPGEELGFLHETDLGLFYQTASIKDSMLVLSKADFKLPKRNGQTPVLNKTAIVKVMEKERWLQLIQGKDSIAHLQGDVTHFGYFTMGSVTREIDPETGEVTETRYTYAAEILDELGPPRFIKKRKLVKDLRFHLRQCKAPDIETFMEEYKYEDYIWDTYGNVYDPILNSVLRNDLHLRSQFDNL